MNKIIVYKDEDNEIVVSKDHYHGVVVQVIRYIDTLQQTSSGELMSLVKAQVIATEKVNVHSDMRNQVQQAIQKCQAVVNDLKEKDKKINGLMLDLFSGYRELNEPRKQ